MFCIIIYSKTTVKTLSVVPLIMSLLQPFKNTGDTNQRTACESQTESLEKRMKLKKRSRENFIHLFIYVEQTYLHRL
jgi:hypothetical protein